MTKYRGYACMEIPSRGRWHETISHYTKEHATIEGVLSDIFEVSNEQGAIIIKLTVWRHPKYPFKARVSSPTLQPPINL